MTYQYTVTDNQRITASTLLLTLQNTAPGDFLSFQPGQYAAISFMRHHRPSPARCFSIVNSPTEQGVLQFSMRVKGHFTSGVDKLVKGDLVEVRAPYGGFVFNSTLNKECIFMAGGIGITPFISMLRFATQTQSSSKITLLYSVPTQDDVPFSDELQQLAQKNPNFRLMFVVDQGPTDRFSPEHTTSGRISPELIAGAGGFNSPLTSYFICGSPGFMNGMIGVLQKNGVPQKQIVTEAFSQGPNRQTGKMVDWPFNMYVLGAMGMVLGSFVIMASDMLKTYPKITSQGTTGVQPNKQPGNSRQKDLDQLVNSLAGYNSTSAISDLAQKSIDNAIANSQIPAATQSTTYIPPAGTTTPTQTIVQQPKTRVS